MGQSAFVVYPVIVPCKQRKQLKLSPPTLRAMECPTPQHLPTRSRTFLTMTRGNHSKAPRRSSFPLEIKVIDESWQVQEHEAGRHGSRKACQDKVSNRERQHHSIQRQSIHTLTLGFYKAYPSDDINLPNKVPASPFFLTCGSTLGISPEVIAIVGVAVAS